MICPSYAVERGLSVTSSVETGGDVGEAAIGLPLEHVLVAV